MGIFLFLVVSNVLLTETQSLDDCTIAIDIGIVQMLKELTTLTYQHGE